MGFIKTLLAIGVGLPLSSCRGCSSVDRQKIDNLPCHGTSTLGYDSEQCYLRRTGGCESLSPDFLCPMLAKGARY
jgi:hypothetical protein